MEPFMEPSGRNHWQAIDAPVAQEPAGNGSTPCQRLRPFPEPRHGKEGVDRRPRHRWHRTPKAQACAHTLDQSHRLFEFL